MGDPRKIRSKINKPAHPWQKERIDEEKTLKKEYGINRKKEIWIMMTVLANMKQQIKKLTASSGEQAEKEKELLINRAKRLGLLKEGEASERILELQPRDILERRLQTIVYKKEFARSAKQARQFITHGHIIINGAKVTSPSYVVPIEEETQIKYSEKSALNDPMHPERVPPEKVKEELKKKQEVVKEAKKETADAMTQKPKVSGTADAEPKEEAKKE